MKKNKKDKSPENSELKKLKTVTINSFEKKTGPEQGGENPNFPEEYEEQLSPDIRMKPQPLIKPDKRRGLKVCKKHQGNIS